MFKRSTKITSLLVAAASVISMVPAMAADVQRVDSEDGKIYKAFAYKDGNFYVDGEIDDNEEVSLYSDGKLSKLDDVDSDSDAVLYGEKYVKVDDGDYYVDLSTGKVTDDDLAEDDEDDAASALRKKIKDDTDDRYDETDSDKIQDLTLLSGNKYGEVWYEASVLKTGATTDTYDIYTDMKGNYIDADYNLGKIKVEPTTGSSVDVENLKDDYNFGKVGTTENKDNLKASIGNTQYLAQDSKYIYRKADIKLEVTNDSTTKKGTAVIDKVFGIDVSDSNAFASTSTTNGQKVEFTVIQKISKAQDSDDVDGAKYAKEVTNYVISKDDGATYGSDDKFVVATDWDNTKFTVVDGKLVAYRTNNDDTVDTVTVKLSKKKNLYYTDLADKANEDIEEVDTDVDGNLWRLNGGYIYKWDNDEDWDKVYKVDGSMKHLSVYDKNNIVVYSDDDDDDDVYSIIGGKTAEEEKPVDETPAVTTGWNQAADGTYTYVNADGTKATGWFQSPASGKWFYMDPTTGVMQTGWVQSPASGKWFYMNPSNGDMMTGWVSVNGAWYYMNPSNGDMQTGWIADGADWYYCDASGAMLSNTTVDGYVLGANGAWVK